MIEFLNVSKSFWTGSRHKPILERTTFRLELGRNVAIFGGKAVGKSTLVGLLTGTVNPDEGTIRRSSSISFPLSGMNFSLKLSAADNARTIAQLHGKDPDYIEAYCRFVCDIGEYFYRPMSTYSTSMRSKVNYALILSLDFQMYVIENGPPKTPDSEFDRKTDAILAEKLEAATMILVTDNVKQGSRYCQEGAILSNGQLYFYDEIKAAIEVFEWNQKHGK